MFERRDQARFAMDPYFSQPQPLHLGQDNIHRPMDTGSQSDNAVSNPFGTASEMMEQSSTARYYDDAGLDVDGSFGGPNGLGNGYQDDEGAAVRSSMADMHSPSAGYLGMESEMSMQVMDYSMDSNSYPSENDYQIDMSALASQQAMPFSDQYSATSPHFSTMTDNDNMMNPQHPSYSYRRSGSMSYPQIPELMHNTYTPSAQMARAIGSNPAVTAPHRQSGMGTSSMQRASQPRRPNLQSTNTTGMNSLTVKEENLSSPSSNTLSRAPSIQNQVYAGQTSMERSDSHPEQSMTTGDPTMTETLSKSASLAPPFPFVAKFGCECVRAWRPMKLTGADNGPQPGSRTNFEGIYSTSGFDMLDVLVSSSRNNRAPR